MAIPSRQIGWGTESNLLWQILKQLNKLTSVLFGLKEAATPNYKVYTALLTQSGGDSANAVIDLPLVIGITYEIIDNDGDTADFTNVGAPNNTVGTFFLATGTTPNSWGVNLLGQLEYNDGAPVATVLENTIGNIWFVFNGDGVYQINVTNGWNSANTWYGTSGVGDVGVLNVNPGNTTMSLGNNNLTIVCFNNDYTVTINNQLFNTPIEIRVYN